MEDSPTVSLFQRFHCIYLMEDSPTKHTAYYTYIYTQVASLLGFAPAVSQVSISRVLSTVERLICARVMLGASRGTHAVSTSLRSLVSQVSKQHLAAAMCRSSGLLTPMANGLLHLSETHGFSCLYAGNPGMRGIRCIIWAASCGASV